MKIGGLRNLTSQQAGEWRRFLAAARHQHPRQDPRFADIERALGHVPLFVLGYDAAKLRAVALFSLRRFRLIPGNYTEALALSGPVCDDPTMFRAFLDGLVAEPAFARTGAIRITPYWLDGDADTLTVNLAGSRWRLSDPAPFRETGLLDLDKSSEEILASFSKSARREVRRAKRQGVEIRPIETLKEARVFFDSLNRLGALRGLPRIVPKEYETAFPRIYSDPSIGTILGAYVDGAFLSGLLLYRSRDVAHGRRFTTEPVALRALSNLRIAPLLWWSAMIWAKEQGCRHLDVEGYREDMEKTNRLYNVNKYKGEFNPRPVRRFEEHTLVLNRLLHVLGAQRYRVRAALKRRMPGLVRIVHRMRRR